MYIYIYLQLYIHIGIIQLVMIYIIVPFLLMVTLRYSRIHRRLDVFWLKLQQFFLPGMSQIPSVFFDYI